MFSGLKVFFKTRRYLAYLIVFVITTVMAILFSYILTIPDFHGQPIENILVNVFVFVGATGTIYFMLGTLFTFLKLDNLWITRRGRGRVTELKGVVWIAISFALSVFLRILIGPEVLFFFAAICWVGWIGFQAYLSSRTSLRIATIVEPKKGSAAIGIGSFFVLIVGIGIIAAEAVLALWIIPNDLFGISSILGSIFTEYQNNVLIHSDFLIVAFGLLGLFALVSLINFFRYAKKGAALNIALLVVFIAIYSGYFLVNVMRRTGAPSIELADVLMSIFFLAYALSGIGRTVTESVEESRGRLRDVGPLFVFFLASGFFFVDSIIAVTNSGSAVGSWFFLDWNEATTYATFIFRDVAKLLAFPLVALFTSIVYLRTERVERIVERARDEGEKYTADEVDEEIAERVPEPGEDWTSERAEGVKEGDQGHKLSAPDSSRLSVDDSRRLKKVRRLGEDEEDEE
jgi:hypothetical protein